MAQHSEILNVIDTDGCSIEYLLNYFSKTTPCEILLFCHTIAELLNEKILIKDGEKYMKSIVHIVNDDLGEPFASASYLAEKTGLNSRGFYRKAEKREISCIQKNGKKFFSMKDAGVSLNDKQPEKVEESSKNMLQITITCDNFSVVKRLLEDFSFSGINEITVKKVM